MTTSHVTTEPFETNVTEISDGTFAYFNSRNRMHVFSLVNKEFERSGITQADLAKRMKKGADRICRLLNAPGNWTLDTVSELLLAISGAEVSYTLSYPFELAKTISSFPEKQINSTPFINISVSTSRSSSENSYGTVNFVIGS